ncbi:MAG: DUF2267 domain-containing protein [Pseudonocardiaceae bacterium]|nr:DUF2267 domain-containing protein [Pseudonocardiaceae bacterium]
MTYPEPGGPTKESFISQVQDKIGVQTREEAERVARATLRTLAEQVSSGEMGKLASALPPELRDELAGVRGQAQSFGKDTFLDTITGQIDTVSLDTAEHHVRGVLRVVRAWTPDEDVETAREQLPPGISELFA